MNSATKLEHRASSSRSKHEGEPSIGLCDRLSRTRDNSQRQLPTDHDYAVPTREYQLDQSSPLPATAAADSVLEVQRQKQPQRMQMLTGSHHINVRVGGDWPRVLINWLFVLCNHCFAVCPDCGNCIPVKNSLVSDEHTFLTSAISIRCNF